VTDAARLPPRRRHVLDGGLAQLASPPAWLLPAADADAVSGALAETVPELGARGRALESLEVRRLRIKERTWDALVRVTVAAAPGVAAAQTFDLRGRVIPPAWGDPDGDGSGGAPFPEAGWRWYSPGLRLELAVQPSDPALPAVPLLTDPDRSARMLEDGVGGSPRYRGFRIGRCVPHVVRYKPGSRCTVVYELKFPPGAPPDWPNRVVAKTYRGNKGENAYRAMHDLWASPLARSATVAIAEPLAFLPEHNVLLQGPVAEEQTLKELLRAAFESGSADAVPRLAGLFERTARGLAELHAAGVRRGEPVTADDELAEIAEVVARLAGPVPELAGALAPTLARLHAAAAAHPADPLAPSHRSFRPAQVLVSAGGDVAFIDFDGFCQAEPALDVAMFRSTVRDIGLRAAYERDDVDASGARGRLAEVCNLFLATYEGAGGTVSHERVALWEAFDLLTGVLHCWTKVKFDRLGYRMELLADHLERSGLAR
jgi:hypothetical protein